MRSRRPHPPRERHEEAVARCLSAAKHLSGQHVLIVFLMLVVSIAIILGHTSVDIASEVSGAEVGALFRPAYNACTCPVEPEPYLIKLHKPWHHFDSNHWFHVAEYYLSRHHRVDTQVPPNASVYIVASDPSFADGLTDVTFFLLQLAFTDGASGRIEVFPPAGLQWQYQSVRSFRSSGPSMLYERSRPVDSRYVVNTRDSEQEEQCYCGKYLGPIGAAPIDRGYWFRGAMDVNNMRKKVQRLCKGSAVMRERFPHVLVSYPYPEGAHTLEEAGLMLDPAGPAAASHATLRRRTQGGGGGGGGAHRQPRRLATSSRSSGMRKLVLYQRDLDRKFSDFDTLLHRLYSRLSDTWEIEIIVHKEDLQPCLLYEALRDADIFLTTHGFQSTSALFMKEGSVLFECFPFKYWKEGYMHLAWEYSLHHRYTQQPSAVSWDRKFTLSMVSQEACMQNLRCRSYARGDDVLITDEQLDYIFETAHDVERGLIGPHNTPLKQGFHRRPPHA